MEQVLTHAHADIKQPKERFYTCILRLVQEMVFLGWEQGARGESLLLGKFSGLSLCFVISEYLISSDNRLSENLQRSTARELPIKAMSKAVTCLTQGEGYHGEQITQQIPRHCLKTKG